MDAGHSISLRNKRVISIKKLDHMGVYWLKCVQRRGRLLLKCDGTRAETRFRLSGETDQSI